MGITDDIRKAIQSKLVLQYCTGKITSQSSICVICKHTFTISEKLAFHIPDEGYVCYCCGKKYAPEMANAFEVVNGPPLKEKKPLTGNNLLSKEEWQDIYDNLEILQNVTMELSKGLSRGIIEAPSGHIGLLHYAKDIVRPIRKDNESDKNYELRLKTYRIKKIYEKLNAETTERVELLHKYFIKLGMSVPKDTKKWNF